MKTGVKGYVDTVRLAFAQPLAVELREGDLPKRIKVLNWGENPNVTGTPVVVGDALARAVKLPLYAWRRVPLDFQHNTVPGTDAYKESKEPREVAGYGDIEVIPGDGVYLTMQSWTPKGLATAHNFACVSATPCIGKAQHTPAQGNVLGITSVALCRNGAVPGMDFVDVPLSAFLPTGADDDPPPHKSKTESRDMDWKKMLIELLKLEDGAADEEIAAALKEWGARASAQPAPLAADAEMIAKAVAAAVQPLAASVAGFQGELDKRDKQAILDGAKAQGKVVALAAGVLGKMTVAELQDHVTALPVTVPLAAVTPDNVQQVPLGAGITETQRAVARQCGMDPDKVFGTKQ